MRRIHVLVPAILTFVMCFSSCGGVEEGERSSSGVRGETGSASDDEEIAEVAQAAKYRCKKKTCCWGRVTFKGRTLDTKKSYPSCDPVYIFGGGFEYPKIKGEICEEKRVPGTRDNRCRRICTYDRSKKKLINKCRMLN